jgi:hypothetical protein
LTAAERAWHPLWPHPVRATFDFVTNILESALTHRPERPCAEVVAVFLTRVLRCLTDQPAFGNVEEGQAEVVDVVFQAGETVPVIRLGLRRDEDGGIWIAVAGDWVMPPTSTPESGEPEAVLRLAKQAHVALVRLSELAPPEREGLFLVSWKELFDDLALPFCKPGGYGDGHGWRLVQSRFAWEKIGALQPRAFIKSVARLLAEQNGSALLRLMRDSKWYSPTRTAFVAACYLAVQGGYARRNGAGELVAVVTDPNEVETAGKLEAMAVTPVPVSQPSMHRSQREAFARCLSLGQLHFSGRHQNLPLRPRTFPLLVGPSGVGKSHLATQVAKELGAHLLPLTFGRWMPAGARDSRQTMFAILDALAGHERLVVFLDELDKCGGWDGSWSRSVANDIWAALDGVFPLDTYQADKESAKALTTADLARLWIIGAGTWQSQTEPSSERKPIGFVPSTVLAAEPSSADVIARVRVAREVPVELLARFHSEPIHMSYPRPEEVPALFSQYGVVELAAEAGVDLASVKLDFSKGGVRVIEAFIADLLLKIQAKVTPQEIDHHG